MFENIVRALVKAPPRKPYEAKERTDGSPDSEDS